MLRIISIKTVMMSALSLALVTAEKATQSSLSEPKNALDALTPSVALALMLTAYSIKQCVSLFNNLENLGQAPIPRERVKKSTYFPKRRKQPLEVSLFRT